MATQAKVTGSLKGLQATIARLEELALHTVHVGVPAGVPYKNRDGSTSAFTLAQVVEANEFGTENIPERPAMRRGIRKGKAGITKAAQAVAKGVERGTVDVARGMEIIGTVAKEAVVNEITNGHFVPNAPITIARKGSSKPLIDSGQYRKSVTFTVERAG